MSLVHQDAWVVTMHGAPYLFVGCKPTKENGADFTSPQGAVGRLASDRFPAALFTQPKYCQLVYDDSDNGALRIDNATSKT